MSIRAVEGWSFTPARRKNPGETEQGVARSPCRPNVVSGSGSEQPPDRFRRDTRLKVPVMFGRPPCLEQTVPLLGATTRFVAHKTPPKDGVHTSYDPSRRQGHRDPFRGSDKAIVSRETYDSWADRRACPRVLSATRALHHAQYPTQSPKRPTDSTGPSVAGQITRAQIRTEENTTDHTMQCGLVQFSEVKSAAVK